MYIPLSNIFQIMLLPDGFHQNCPVSFAVSINELIAAPKESLHSFGAILAFSTFFQKYLKEKCWSDHDSQLSFKYFVD